VWGRLGWYTYLTDSGTTWYNHALQSWIRYAESGESRFYRRALATQKAFRYFASITSGGYAKLVEASADIAQSLVYYALTQRPFDTLNTAAAVEVAAARQVLTRNEAADYNGHSATTPGLYSTGRWAMHVIQGCPWFARLGVDPGAGYTLGTLQTMAKDTNLWPHGPSWASVSTAAEHFARMCDRIHTSMVTDAANSPGMRYIGQPGYLDHSPWMSHWLWSYMALGLRTFGVPVQYPGGPLSDATDGIVKDMTDSLEYDFSGLSKYNANPFYVTTVAGDRAFTFGTPGAASNGGSTATYTNLSGTSLLALAYMKQTTTGAARALWASRGAAVYSGMQRYKDGTTQFFYWNAKDLPEADLVGSAYLAEAA
jgi:hypothetical protein